MTGRSYPRGRSPPVVLNGGAPTRLTELAEESVDMGPEAPRYESAADSRPDFSVLKYSCSLQRVNRTLDE
jgi:hypothetical protein